MGNIGHNDSYRGDPYIPSIIPPISPLENAIDYSLDYLSICDRLNIKDLSHVALLQLYDALKNPSGELKNYPDRGCLFFLVKETILRRTGNDENALREFAALTQNDEQLSKEIKNSKTSIFELSKVSKDSRPVMKSDQPQILHASLEYTKAKYGGVGSVAESLVAKQVAAGYDSRIVTPFWDFYQNDPAFIEKAEFKGFINHEFEGKFLKSSVYKVWSQDGKVAQYLIHPDPNYTRLFDIGKSVNIYENLPHTFALNRYLFLTSAFAATAALYRGKKSQKNFDILHFHPWTVGLSANIMKEHYNPLREMLGRPPVHTVQHFHSSSFEEQGTFPTSVYKSLGLKIPISTEFADIQHEGLLYLDMVIHVSKALAEKAVDPARGGAFLKASQYLEKNKRLVGVINGITHKSYDITDQDTYKELAIQRVLRRGMDGKIEDSTDYISKKGEVKKVLFDQGVISDPDKPLFVFVGRLSYDKGIDLLPAMVEQIAREGGQCLIMGANSWEPEEITKLKKYAEKNPSILTVYTELKDQQKCLDNSKVSRGHAIRLASDFFLIPSQNESCGLVGMEALAAGGIIITSQVEGLRDFCLGWGDPSREETVDDKNFNSFAYSNIEDRTENACDAIARAMRLYFKLPKEEKNKIIARIVESSRKFDWNTPDGPVDKIIRAYRNAMKSRSLDEIEDLKRQRHHYINVHSPISQKLLEARLATARQSRSLPSIALIDFADKNFDLKDPTALSLEVKWQILHASSTTQTTRGKEFGFKHLNMEELATFLDILMSFCCSEEGKKASPLFHQYTEEILSYVLELNKNKDLKNQVKIHKFIQTLDHIFKAKDKQEKEKFIKLSPGPF